MSIYLNGYISKKKIPEKTWVGKITLVERVEDRRRLQQSKCTLLNREGIISCVAPKKMQKEGYDIIFFGKNKERLIRKTIGEQTKISVAKEMHSHNITDIISRTWKNVVRINLQRNNYWHFKNEYIHQSEIIKPNKFKKSFIIQAEIINQHLFLWIKPKHKVMEQIDNNSIKLANSEEIPVRVLPRWSKGRLRGKGTWSLEENPSIFWKKNNSINFVKDEEDIVKVEFDKFGSISEFTYPKSCVFKEYKHIRLPGFLKINPYERIKKSTKFLNENIKQVQFLEDTFTFEGPVNISQTTYSHEIFDAEIKVQVLVKENNEKRPLTIFHKEILRKLGDRIFPFGDTVDLEYVVIKPTNLNVADFITRLREIYSRKNFGNIQPYTPQKVQSKIIKGLIEVENKGFHEYEKTAFEVQNIVQKEEPTHPPFCFVILPNSDTGNDIYYSLRRTFFSPFDKNRPILHTQSIKSSTIESFNRDKKDFSIHNILGQIYTKTGKEGTVPWILGEPADKHVKSIEGSVTSYSFFDVSRRYERKTQSSVFTAITDSYGRFIFSGSFPSGSEKLELYTAYEMILSILRQSVRHSNRVGNLSDYFKFKRLVFAKDGIMYDSDAETIKTAFYEGIKEQNRKPIKELLNIDNTLPTCLVVDLIGVNKNPKKEIYLKNTNSRWLNVNQGTFVRINDKQGLLVSSRTKEGTNIPLELSLLDHLCFNCQIPSPDIREIAQEYYNLTFLNWNSVYYKGKYSLPQIITQAIGENLTAGVYIPENYLCI